MVTGAHLHAWLYDPETNTWSTTGEVVRGYRSNYTATLLNNGKVLVVGGIDAQEPSKSAELYDPVSNTWTTTGDMQEARVQHGAVLLNNGKVLVFGGQDNQLNYLTSAELYDPITGVWSKTNSMSFGRISYSVTLLKNGQVLVAGGINANTDYSIVYEVAEIYDPTTGTWSNTGKLLYPRIRHTAHLLDDGTVVIIGGYRGSGSPLDIIEAFDPATKTWRVFGRNLRPRLGHASTLLPNGKLFIVGGTSSNGDPSSLSSATEIGTIAEDTDTPTGTISINAGALATTSQDVVLALSAQDATSGVGEISLSNDGQTWEPWQRYSESLEWKLSSGDGPKTVYVRFKDYAGNVSAPVSRSIRLDSAAGNEYGLTINNGALFTNQITVELRLSAPALTPEMMISNDGGFAGATWEPYNSVRSWQITQYGSYVLPRTVYVRFRDASGKVFGPYQDDILLDVNAPTGSVTVLSALTSSEQPATTPSADTAADYSVLLPFVTKTGECPAAGTVNVTLALSAEDDVSGVADMIISNSQGFACAKWEPFSKTKAWKVAANAETPIYVRFRDHAGNVSTVYSTVTRP